MRRTRKLSICLAALLILQGALPACLGEEMPASTQAATEVPTEVPTEAPTEAPTETPTEAPTEAPTETPTEAPTEASTETPTEAPTEAPTETPTEAPTELPTEAPTETPTEAPTEAPTEVSTGAPAEAPTPSPELCVDERYLNEGLSVSAAGETARFIEVIGNAAWQAYCDADWVTLKNATVGDKCGFTLDIAENVGEARACTVSIEAEGCEKLSIAITQQSAQEPAQDSGPEDQSPTDRPDEEPAQIEQVERDYGVGWKGVVQSDARGMAIPLLLQGDYGVTVLYYNGQPKSVASSGCGAASVSMAPSSARTFARRMCRCLLYTSDAADEL